MWHCNVFYTNFSMPIALGAFFWPTLKPRWRSCTDTPNGCESWQSVWYKSGSRVSDSLRSEVKGVVTNTGSEDGVQQAIAPGIFFDLNRQLVLATGFPELLEIGLSLIERNILLFEPLTLCPNMLWRTLEVKSSSNTLQS